MEYEPSKVDFTTKYRIVQNYQNKKYFVEKWSFEKYSSYWRKVDYPAKPPKIKKPKKPKLFEILDVFVDVFEDFGKTTLSGYFNYDYPFFVLAFDTVEKAEEFIEKDFEYSTELIKQTVPKHIKTIKK